MNYAKASELRPGDVFRFTGGGSTMKEWRFVGPTGTARGEAESSDGGHCYFPCGARVLILRVDRRSKDLIPENHE